MTVVEGERRFAAPRERVFELLTSPDVIASALPAVRGHRVVDADHWEAKVKPPLPLAPAVTIRFEVLERRPPEHAALHAHGGGADVTSRFDLAADDGATVMRWRTDLHLTGLLAHLGGHGLHAIAERQAARTLDAVERAL
ncbi:MAG TPA: SRPBCC domain-containing protein [Gaiellaceae bacterium]|nr:SRPBCC domain-containing protein [Gaiellaceae bacterium]